MSTLYEITGSFLMLLEMLEDDEPINEQAFKDTLEAIEGEFEYKADNYARIIRSLHREAEKYSKEAERMQLKAEALRNNEARLKQHLYDNMKITGKTKFKTDLFSFSIQGNGGKRPMDIIPGVKIPDEYCRIEPDNGKIRAALESGEKLEFAELRQRGEHLVIR